MPLFVGRRLLCHSAVTIVEYAYCSALLCFLQSEVTFYACLHCDCPYFLIEDPSGRIEDLFGRIEDPSGRIENLFGRID